MPSAPAVLANPERRFETAASGLRRADLRFGLALFVLTFALFCGSAFNGFVSIDDWRYITSNRHVQAGLTWQTILWSFSSVDASNWHPLAYLSSALDCQLFGLNPAGHHLVSALIHAASASLLYFILVRMSGARWISWACAAIFSAHPLRVESVVWAAERKDVLATFFVLLTVLAYLHHAGRPSTAAYWAWTIAFVLGILSKPMVMTTPVLLLLLDYWPLHRFDSDFLANFRAAVLRKAPHFLIAIGAGIVAIYASRRGGDLVPMSGVYSASHAAANAVVSIVLYLWKTIWPIHLFSYYLPQAYVPVWEWLSCAIIVALITCFCLERARRSPWFIVGWLWFLVGVAPVLGFPKSGLQSMADRFSYIPSIGLFFAAAATLARWQPSNRLAHRLIASAMAAILLVLSALTIRQVGFWKDSITLFSHAVAIDPDNWYAQASLGEALGAEARDAGAERHLAISEQLHPGQPMVEYDLGNLLLGRGDDAAAQQMYARAVQSDPGFAAARRKWANLLLRSGQLQQAAEQYQIYLKADPDDAAVHNNLGTALARLGQTDQAVTQFDEALRLDPALTNARVNLGRVHATTHP